MSDATRIFGRARVGDGCWDWAGFKLPNGYGRVAFRGRVWLAHRAAYTLAVGEIPEGLTIDHLCRNVGCIRPDHLEPVTQQVNSNRGIGPSAVNSRKTHCKRGHPLSGPRVWLHKSSNKNHKARRCMDCAVIRMREFYARQKAKRAASEVSP